jgi:hypothetical protein
MLNNRYALDMGDGARKVTAAVHFLSLPNSLLKKPGFGAGSLGAAVAGVVPGA